LGGVGRAAADDQVGACVERGEERRHVLGAVGEVALEHHARVAARVARVGDHVTHERLGGRAAPAARRGAPAEERQREDARVRGDHLGRAVGAAVVEDHDLVVAPRLAEHGAQAPEQHADRGRFVVDGDADVEHGGARAEARRPPWPPHPRKLGGPAAPPPHAAPSVVGTGARGVLVNSLRYGELRGVRRLVAPVGDARGLHVRAPDGATRRATPR
jgi:hypothetical protein